MAHKHSALFVPSFLKCKMGKSERITYYQASEHINLDANFHHKKNTVKILLCQHVKSKTILLNTTTTTT